MSGTVSSAVGLTMTMAEAGEIAAETVWSEQLDAEARDGVADLLDATDAPGEASDVEAWAQECFSEAESAWSLSVIEGSVTDPDEATQSAEAFGLAEQARQEFLAAFCGRWESLARSVLDAHAELRRRADAAPDDGLDDGWEAGQLLQAAESCDDALSALAALPAEVAL